MSERYATEKQLSFIARLATQQGIQINTSGMTLQQASDTITKLLANSVSTPAVTEVGMYLNAEGVIFKVQRSERGRLYAKQLNASGRGFTYVQGAITHLTPEMRMTLEQAQAFGVALGSCVVCGRELTDPVSVARGIGPVCAESEWGVRAY